MHPSRFPIRTVLAALACLVSFGAQAQITKCIDASGRVSYSDDGCANGVQIGVIEADPPPPVAQQPVARPASQMAIDNLPIRETAWAAMPAVAHHSRTDAATIRAARNTLASEDRGLAAMRSQKLASK